MIVVCDCCVALLCSIVRDWCARLLCAIVVCDCLCAIEARPTAHGCDDAIVCDVNWFVRYGVRVRHFALCA